MYLVHLRVSSGRAAVGGRRSCRRWIAAFVFPTIECAFQLQFLALGQALRAGTEYRCDGNAGDAQGDQEASADEHGFFPYKYKKRQANVRRQFDAPGIA